MASTGTVDSSASTGTVLCHSLGLFGTKRWFEGGAKSCVLPWLSGSSFTGKSEKCSLHRETSLTRFCPLYSDSPPSPSTKHAEPPPGLEWGSSSYALCIMPVLPVGRGRENPTHFYCNIIERKGSRGRTSIRLLCD
ncbi:unnamed protein product [Victoria cruziana]